MSNTGTIVRPKRMGEFMPPFCIGGAVRDMLTSNIFITGVLLYVDKSTELEYSVAMYVSDLVVWLARPPLWTDLGMLSIYVLRFIGMAHVLK